MFRKKRLRASKLVLTVTRLIFELCIGCVPVPAPCVQMFAGLRGEFVLALSLSVRCWQWDFDVSCTISFSAWGTGPTRFLRGAEFSVLNSPYMSKVMRNVSISCTHSSQTTKTSLKRILKGGSKVTNSGKKQKICKNGSFMLFCCPWGCGGLVAALKWHWCGQRQLKASSTLGPSGGC